MIFFSEVPQNVIQEAISITEAALYILTHKEYGDNFIDFSIMPTDIYGNLYGEGFTKKLKATQLRFYILPHKEEYAFQIFNYISMLESKKYMGKNLDELFFVGEITNVEDGFKHLIATATNNFNCSYKKVIRHLYKELKIFFPKLKFKSDGSRIMYS